MVPVRGRHLGIIISNSGDKEKRVTAVFILRKSDCYISKIRFHGKIVAVMQKLRKFLRAFAKVILAWIRSATESYNQEEAV